MKSDQFLITIRNMNTNEEKKTIIYADTFVAALLRFVNQISLGPLAKIIPEGRKKDD